MKNDKKILTEYNEKIFEYIKPYENDMLSKLKGIDLQNLIILIDDYYISLRDNLGIDDYITFGLELEFENAMKSKIEQKIYETFLNHEWILKSDSSLHKGAEIATPILRDTKENWQTIKLVCEIISKYATIGTKAGGHIHVGTQVLGYNEEYWLNFIKLWSIYENIIFRFSFGNYLTARPNIYKFAKPMANIFSNDCEILKIVEANLNGIIKRVNRNRYQAVNFSNVSPAFCDDFEEYNTIEFRCPNGTLDPIIWQNNVNFFIKFLLYSKSINFDADIINKRQSINKQKYNKLNYYNEIFLDQSLELCDMIFDNNFDKVYFLRQYLKSFKVTKDFKYLETASLTRKK